MHFKMNMHSSLNCGAQEMRIDCAIQFDIDQQQCLLAIH